ncbi:hypothetical protein BB560_007296 [Smittium megazygosporum]|uniref:NADH dehydrogenase [ubiquinone] 1 alpha subcomplex assembly factor 3 n=1 Tax=Smittium megazygosporum TaxID=133381 RepID=A0A2T9XX27_9FUNG|nr:hypothetical protein BB560_007296 [Smittium megazygosporum]
MCFSRMNSTKTLPAQQKRMTILTNMFDREDFLLPVKEVKKDGFVLMNDKTVDSNLFLVDNVPFEWKVADLLIGTQKQKASKGEQKASNIQGASTTLGINVNCLKILELVSPKPEILVLGTGAKMLQVPNSVREYLVRLGIKLEVSKTFHACGTFNFLLDEGRSVALATVLSSFEQH